MPDRTWLLTHNGYGELTRIGRLSGIPPPPVSCPGAALEIEEWRSSLNEVDYGALDRNALGTLLGERLESNDEALWTAQRSDGSALESVEVPGRDVLGSTTRPCAPSDGACASRVGNTLGFASAPFSAETGLYDMRARTYHPGLRIFTTRDPLPYADSFDPWRYAIGDPVTWLNPWGLDAERTMSPGHQTARSSDWLASWSIVKAVSADAGLSTWTTAATLVHPRGGASATVLNDGRILVAGGQDFPYGPSNSLVERCDLAIGTCEALPPMPTGRMGHTAYLAIDGRVWMVGGTGPSLRHPAPSTTTDVYDPGTTTWTTHTLPLTLFEPAIQPLSGDRLLIADHSSGPLQLGVLDLATLAWQPLADGPAELTDYPGYETDMGDPGRRHRVAHGQHRPADALMGPDLCRGHVATLVRTVGGRASSRPVVARHRRWPGSSFEREPLHAVESRPTRHTDKDCYTAHEVVVGLPQT